MKEGVDKGDFELVREIVPGSKIHVCKNSHGWLPLFQAQEYLWRSVEEIKRHYSVLHPKIVDDYGEELNWYDFEQKVINWNGGYIGAIPRMLYENGITIPYPYEDPHAPKYIPISHFEYENGRYSNMYFKDPEGYEFTWSEFS